MTITAGSLLYTHTGANVSKMEEVLQQLQTPDEKPVAWQFAFQAASVACAVRPCVICASSAEEEGGIHDM